VQRLPEVLDRPAERRIEGGDLVPGKEGRDEDGARWQRREAVWLGPSQPWQPPTSCRWRATRWPTSRRWAPWWSWWSEAAW